MVTYRTTLTQDQIEFLKRYGQTRETKAGQVLLRASDVSNDFIVVLEGEVERIDDFAGDARSMGFSLQAVSWAC
jgi:hypothetical protein